MEEPASDQDLYTLYSLGGAPCILLKTRVTFYLQYRTHTHGPQSVRIDLPAEPEISGSCVREGDTAVLTMRWSVFNFTLIYTENPEGNSYYLNTAVLRYNQSLAAFADANYRGDVKVQTKKGWNYYFTPLGKSYVCVNGEDQGPLSLFNVHGEKVGNMSLYNTKVQPFVKRAKGDWGPGKQTIIIMNVFNFIAFGFPTFPLFHVADNFAFPLSHISAFSSAAA